MTAEAPLCWVIGRGGLLGSAVDRACTDRFVGSRVPWGDAEAAGRVLAEDLGRFRAAAGDRDWAVVWAAGSGVIGTSRQHLDVETATLLSLCRELGRAAPRGRGAFFLSSSAGGVFAGSQRAPFDESSDPVPISDYGAVKLAQESAVVEAVGGAARVVVGRLSNVYGPGQNLHKGQGLITQLCLSLVLKRPAKIFVPMDTLRDYLYVDQAAAMVLASVRAALAGSSAEPRVRVLASQRSSSISELVAIGESLARRRLQVLRKAGATSRFQVHDLRLRSRCTSEWAGVRPVQLVEGFRHVYTDVLGRAAHGELSDLRAH